VSIEMSNPEGLVKPRGYSHIAIAQGRRVAYVSGQVGIDGEGKIVSTDAAEQTRQALRNLQICLDSLGASYADVARVAIYAVDVATNGRAIGQACGEFLPAANPPAGVVLGVAGLARPDFLVEIEAVVVLD
jgi:enamine deaminase RidA (YjgF/YER057c/UK114 family)